MGAFFENIDLKSWRIYKILYKSYYIFSNVKENNKVLNMVLGLNMIE